MPIAARLANNRSGFAPIGKKFPPNVVLRCGDWPFHWAFQLPYAGRNRVDARFMGSKIDEQISRLRRPTHVVVATPGRLIDLVEKKAINLENVHTVVLDEADEMLSMGFKKQLTSILEMSESAVSHQLRTLRSLRLVSYTKRGRKAHGVTRDSKAR